MPGTNPPTSHEGVADFLSLAGGLKRLRRQGWIDRGVESPESVADHSYRLALMVLTASAGDPDIDVARALRLALVHDLPEAIAGDVTPFDRRLSEAGIDRDRLFREAPIFDPDSDRDKTDAERRAMSELTSNLPSSLSEMLIELWEEYEAGETPEARLVRQLDKLETWLQALEYRDEQPELVIGSFRLGTDRDVTDPALRALLAAINRRFDGESD